MGFFAKVGKVGIYSTKKGLKLTKTNKKKKK